MLQPYTRRLTLKHAKVKLVLLPLLLKGRAERRKLQLQRPGHRPRFCAPLMPRQDLSSTVGHAGKPHEVVNLMTLQAGAHICCRTCHLQPPGILFKLFAAALRSAP